MDIPLRELQYPIGEFKAPAEVRAEQVTAWIDDLEKLPADLRRTVEPLTDEQLATPYRPDGWTVRQVVHHIPDSHLNSYVRFHWALTESRPEIKAYWEDRWALLPDYAAPIGLSLDLLDALHARWTVLLRGLRPQDLEREFLHPEQGAVRLDVNIGIYAWHGRHHLAHITRLADREGW